VSQHVALDDNDIDSFKACGCVQLGGDMGDFGKGLKGDEVFTGSLSLLNITACVVKITPLGVFAREKGQDLIDGRKANSKVHDGLCQHCKGVLEWKVKYNKYKSLTQPKKCVKCSQKTVKDAYHIICKPCSLQLEICCKCGKKEDIVIPINSQVDKQEQEEDGKQKKGRGKKDMDGLDSDDDDDSNDLGEDDEDYNSDSVLTKTQDRSDVVPDVSRVYVGAPRSSPGTKTRRSVATGICHCSTPTDPTEVKGWPAPPGPPPKSSTSSGARLSTRLSKRRCRSWKMRSWEWTRGERFIAFIGKGEELDRLSQTFKFSPSDVIQLAQHEFFMPGMVDTHIHAPQYSYAGTALDMPLLQWLNNYTFPVESRFQDLEYARRVYTQVVRRTLRNGTTTACYFATIHTEASLLLGQITNDFGQRALVGKVCMDRNNFVKHYKETIQECQEETCRCVSTVYHSTRQICWRAFTHVFIAELLNKKYPLVKPVVTPRFAPSCSGALLGQLGAIAKNNNLHIQSHISENVEEVNLVKELFPESKSYTEVYHKYNLLTDKTVMAHGCHLTDEELTLFRETGASLSHCPNSNISLCSGVLNVRNVLNHKVKLGLGTDVAGGYSASMLDAVRKALDSSKVLTIQDPEHVTLTFEEVFRLATLGGSQALSLDDQTGNFEVGKDFDALRVNVAAAGGPIDLFQCEEPKVGNSSGKILELG
ncbi:hypothetical protein L3Q82_022932, partial [Scortum barcoo]